MLEIRQIGRCYGLQNAWEKYSGSAQPPPNVFLLDIHLEHVTFHFETRISCLKIVYFLVMFSQPPIEKSRRRRASASLEVNFVFSWLRLCQEQAICAQPATLARTNKHSITKK